VLSIEQVQSSSDGTPAVFHVPVEIEVRTADGARTHRVELEERRQQVRLPCDSAPEYVRFDVHGAIPKRVHEEKQPSEWAALARACDDVNARREAVLVLGRMAHSARERDPAAEIGPLVEALVTRLGEDGSAWVRADAATALGQAGGDDARAALRRAALEDDAARVRVAALHALRWFGPDPELALVAEEAFAEGFSYQTMAAAAALLCTAAPGRGFEFLAAGLELVTPHDMLAGHLLRHLAELPDPRVPAELRRHATDTELAPTARAVAVECLSLLPAERGEAARTVVPLLAEESFHLRLAAVRALVAFGDPGARRALADYYPRTRTAEERRAIESLLDTP
jgi:HEAT repeat protein